MDPVFNVFFGPLGRKFCLWFLALSIIPFIALVLLVLSSLYLALVKKRSVNVYGVLVASIGYLILYFQNRLLYSMCSGTSV